MNSEPEFDPAFEAELRKTLPAKLDDHLLGRLEQAGTGTSAQSRPMNRPMNYGWKFWLMPGMALTALAMILTLKPAPTLAPTAPHAQQKPAPSPAHTATASAANQEEPIDLFPARRFNEISSTYEGNIINLPGQPPYRHVRARMVDTYTWEDPNGATRVDFTVPRDEHFLIPAEIH